MTEAKPRNTRKTRKKESQKKAWLLVFLSCLSCVSWFGSSSALGQHATTPLIESVHVGLPAGSGAQESGRVRPGTWAPVYLKLKAGKEGNPRNAFKVLLRGTDAEDTLYAYPVPVPALAANQDHLAIGYLRPGTTSNEIKIFLQTNDGKTLQTFAGSVRDSGKESVAPTALLVLAAGSRLPSLKEALNAAGPRQPNQPAGLAAQPPGVRLPPGLQPKMPLGPGGAPQAPLAPLNPAENPEPDNVNDREDEGGRRFAFIERVNQLPDEWFGYEAADVVVLTTGHDRFIKDLLEDQTNRCTALLEWVRRGGRLILSVGRNHQDVAELLDKKLPLLDCAVKGVVRAERLSNLQTWVQGDGALANVEIAELQPGPQTHVLVRETVGAKERPVLVQGSCGLGRVLFVGFDLDQPPFTEWNEPRRRAFWGRLLEEMLKRPLKEFRGPDVNLEQAQSADLVTGLHRGLETFDVPVFHFGWVTLFILIYILIVGPLDYFVLKKLFKRLELTWITFPTLVLLVSVAAYALAYWTKGKEVRFNKIDLVEIDLHTPQAYGTTWFSVFSPRPEKYTLGLEPVQPGWVAAPPADKPAGPGTMVATLTAGEHYLPLGGPGLFPQPYTYAEDAAGLDNVPVRVWAARTFVASWRAPLGDPPGIEAELDLSRAQPRLPRGKITNHLPVELQSISLFYHDEWHSFGNLGPGEGRRIDNLFEGNRQGQEKAKWFNEPPQLIAPSVSSQYLFKRVLFHAEAPLERDNTGLRQLDQSWRLRPQVEFPAQGAGVHYRPEIILVARTAPVTGPAEAVSQDSSSPTRLWSSSLPGSVPRRPDLPGVLTQETYVRVYIPVKQ